MSNDPLGGFLPRLPTHAVPSGLPGCFRWNCIIKGEPFRYCPHFRAVFKTASSFG